LIYVYVYDDIWYLLYSFNVDPDYMTKVSIYVYDVQDRIH